MFNCFKNLSNQQKVVANASRGSQAARSSAQVQRWNDVNKYIIKHVKEETDNRQTPVVQSSITQPLYIRQVNTQPSQSDPTEPSNLNIPSSSAAPLRPSQIDTTLQDSIQIFKVLGKLENARIKLTDSLQVFTNKLYGEGQYINFEYLGKSFSFKDVTFEYPNTTELPAYILLDVKRGQKVEVENCSFHKVGLWVRGYGDYSSITNSTFTDIKQDGMRFINTRSVQMSEVGFKNCEWAAVYCFVKKFIGKKIDIQNSDIGFYFYKCQEAQLELHDTNIQNCKNPIELYESANVKQHNVNIIS